MKNRHAFFWLFGLLAIAGGGLRAEPVPVTKTKWNGHQRLDFVVAGRHGLLVVPKIAAAGNPWIWRTEFFDTEPQVDIALLERGWHVAYLNAKDMYGAPPAMKLFDAFYTHVVAEHRLAKRVVLEGFSRGGLYAFNFAAEHPERIAALYLDAPVLDIRSWPGRNRDSKEWRGCLASYGLTEATIADFKGSPVDRVEPVARAGIPIIVVSGDADKTVSFAENTGTLEKRFREAGGTIEVMVKSGGDHHPHSLPDPAPIVDFLLKNARP